MGKMMIKQSLQIGEDTVVYCESAGRGYPVVLLHGNGGDALTFRPQLEGEFGERFHVIAIDLPGHGGESVAHDLQHKIAPQQHAELVAQTAEKLNVPHAVFYGSSYGGTVAIYTSTQLPQAAGFAFCGTLPIFKEGNFFRLEKRAIQMISAMTQPLAVFQGENEPFVNLAQLEALEMPTLWRGAVQIIAGAGHVPHQEKSAIFNQLLTQYIEDILTENNNG
ncbi:MAG: alpha/beta fold hydrolase [Anaerolineales bacterium]|nr:alpha/beta fold hydrolase [Anaerolineales bacterium]